jgi:hypothetical protein
MLGPGAPHHGVELRPELVASARAACAAAGLPRLWFHAADCFGLDVRPEARALSVS